MALTTDQQNIAGMFNKFLHSDTHGEMLIEGFPGTGKSFLTKYLIKMINQSAQLRKLITGNSTDDFKVFCTATTNKAASVLKNLSNEPTETIHSLLKLKVSENLATGTTSIKKNFNWRVLTNVLIIIDEYTYIDKHLLKLIRDSTHKCKILYIGDSYQLISVNDINNSVLSSVKLKGTLNESVRFTKGTPIDLEAAKFRKTIDTGIFTPITYDNKTIIHMNGSEFQTAIDKEFSKNTINSNKSKIIAWTNDTVNDYNNYIRKTLNLSPIFNVGEKVITNKPIEAIGNSEGYNTENIVTIRKVLPDNLQGIKGINYSLGIGINVFQALNQNDVKIYLKELAKECTKNKDWKIYFSTKRKFGDLRSIYACTVYKAQGSTYKNVYLNLSDIGRCNQPNTVARMLHVAFTRASEKVICYGQLPRKYSGV